MSIKKINRNKLMELSIMVFWMICMMSHYLVRDLYHLKFQMMRKIIQYYRAITKTVSVV